LGVEDFLMNPRNPMPPNLAHELRELQRRLETLERAPRLTNASISDPAGVERIVLGLLDDGNYGLEVFDADGGTRLRVDGDGLSAPYLPGVPRDPNEYLVTTSPAFVTVWHSVFQITSHLAIGGQIGWAADPGTTGELRLKLGAETTDAVPLTAGSSGSQNFAWLHNAPLSSGPQYVEIQARRVSGVGNINIYAPMLDMRAAGGATASGV
jgi:hypothetical protein